MHKVRLPKLGKSILHHVQSLVRTLLATKVTHSSFSIRCLVFSSASYMYSTYPLACWMDIHLPLNFYSSSMAHSIWKRRFALPAFAGHSSRYNWC